MRIAQPRARSRRPTSGARIAFAWGRNAQDAAPLPESLSFQTLVERFRLPDKTRGTLTLAQYQALDAKNKEEKALKNREKNGAYFIPCTFSGSRLAANVESLSAFVLDFDDGTVTRRAIAKKLKGLRYVGYTSYSHTRAHPRYRVVVPYSKPLRPDQHQAVFDHFWSLFDGHIDRRSETTSQLWYTPACPRDAGHLFECFAGSGRPLAAHRLRPKRATAMPGDRAPIPDGEATRQGLEHVESALTYVSADEYSIWIKVGLALHHEYGDKGLPVWDAWSQTSKNYDANEVPKKWATFRGSSEKQVSLGTIFHYAKQAGWVAPEGAIPPSIERINKDHFFAMSGGKARVFLEAQDPMFKRRVLTAMSPADFTYKFGNEFIDSLRPDGKRVRQQVSAAWLKHAARREYKNGIRCAPGQKLDGYYNLWQGFTVVPKRGRWPLMRGHIREIVCDRDPLSFDYVLRWMAYGVQNPGKPAEVALAMRGGRGTGKGTVARHYGKLFGQHYLQITNSRHLTGNFNAHLRDCVLLFVDEAFWAGDKAGEAVLKGLITEPTIAIEGKGVDTEQAPNLLHIMIAANADWFIPAALDERRFMVVTVNSSRAKDYPYFKAIEHEMDNGGLAAMLHDLLKLDLSTFNIRDAPQTDALKTQKLLSLEPYQDWWYRKLKTGTLVSLDGSWGTVTTEALVLDYIEHAKRQQYSRRGSETELGIRLKTLLPPGWPKRRKVLAATGRHQHYVYEFPPLAECRRHFERTAELQNHDWEN